MDAFETELEASRAAVLRDFEDGSRSPLAAVAREEVGPGRRLRFGEGDDCDVKLAGVRPVVVAVEGDHFLVDGAPAGPSARVSLGPRFTLRLSHQNFPAAVVLDRQSPRLVDGPRPRWFPPDPRLRVLARLVPAEAAREEIVLSTRGQKRRALRLGALEFSLPAALDRDGAPPGPVIPAAPDAIVGAASNAAADAGSSRLAAGPFRLTALRLLEPGADEGALSIFFRDATTGAESYPVGRYLDPQPEGSAWVLDFNRAYNPLCAFSPLFNCPIPPRENVLPVAIRAGERTPSGH